MRLFFRILFFVLCAVQGLYAQDGPGMPLQPAVSILRVGEARELPTRMDFYTVPNAPYSQWNQSKSAEPAWQGNQGEAAEAQAGGAGPVGGVDVRHPRGKGETGQLRDQQLLACWLDRQPSGDGLDR